MSPPSYARATASSTQKAIPKPQPQPNTTKSQNSPKSQDLPTRKLKRPSLLTPKQRHQSSYKRSLIPITPQTPTSPCPLSTLPSELRSIIYTHVFSFHSHPMRLYNRPTDTFEFIWPALLQVCRAIRLEASYTYFTHTRFTFLIKNLRFTRVQTWIDALPPTHRTWLSHNKNLTIELTGGVKDTYTWPPADFLLDDYTRNHWRACSAFGNLYCLASDPQRRLFVSFCRLAGWWKWCSRRQMRWRYNGGHTDGFSVLEEQDFECLFRFWMVVPLTSAAVQRAWTRNHASEGMKAAALSFFDALEEGHEAWVLGSRSGVEELNMLMGRARRAVGKW